MQKTDSETNNSAYQEQSSTSALIEEVINNKPEF